MMEKLENLITSLNFTEAKNLVTSLNESEIEDYFMGLSFKSENIIFYTFVYDILKEQESALLHYVASLILSQPLCHIEGAYQAAFFHAKKAAELEGKDVKFKEYLLFFNETPDKLLKDQEAKILAQKIIKIKPESEVAKKFI